MVVTGKGEEGWAVPLARGAAQACHLFGLGAYVSMLEGLAQKAPSVLSSLAGAVGLVSTRADAFPRLQAALGWAAATLTRGAHTTAGLLEAYFRKEAPVPAPASDTLDVPHIRPAGR